MDLRKAALQGCRWKSVFHKRLLYKSSLSISLFHQDRMDSVINQAAVQDISVAVLLGFKG